MKRPALLAALVGLFAAPRRGGAAFPPASEPFTLDLRTIPGGALVSVPVLSADLSHYASATDHAFVGLPRACVRDLGLNPNYSDKDGALDQWFGRLIDLGTAKTGYGGLAKRCRRTSW